MEKVLSRGSAEVKEGRPVIENYAEKNKYLVEGME